MWRTLQSIVMSLRGRGKVLFLSQIPLSLPATHICRFFFERFCCKCLCLQRRFLYLTFESVAFLATRRRKPDFLLFNLQRTVSHLNCNSFLFRNIPDMKSRESVSRETACVPVTLFAQCLAAYIKPEEEHFLYSENQEDLLQWSSQAQANLISLHLSDWPPQSLFYDFFLQTFPLAPDSLTTSPPFQTCS